MATRQMTLPCNFSGSMSYLQVPGQENRSGNSARLSPSIERRMRLPSGGIDEVEQSETANSPIIMRRRLGPQSSIESYYSFASEGDGDIFASVENLGLRKGRVQRQTSFCIPDSNISEYSEFNEDFNSSISELFCHRQRGRLENQGTFSEQGSIRSLSIDQEEITFELPGMRAEEINAVEPENESSVSNSNFLNIPAEFAGAQDYVQDLQFEDYDGYVSSSCSISMSSDMESSHQITVPVFIEPAPPEIRFGGVPLLPAEGFSDFWREDVPRLVHQETMHTDSGLDTEEICPATPTGGRFSAEALSPVSPFNKRSGPEDENLRMVLVRDIGIQCCAAESPNLNSHRRSQSCENSEQAERPSSLSGKFPSELLF